MVDTLRSSTGALTRTATGAAERARPCRRRADRAGPGPETPLAGRLSQQRRVVSVTTQLADYRRIRDVHGGTVNDVILATVAGGCGRG